MKKLRGSLLYCKTNVMKRRNLRSVNVMLHTVNGAGVIHKFRSKTRSTAARTHLEMDGGNLPWFCSLLPVQAVAILDFALILEIADVGGIQMLLWQCGSEIRVED
ncbi:uncharacterized protein LOC124198096 isoform X2 [Daphnia pulex]|uniref:uncharacterized protein LOC124198096 isoform X2 n=1 Tax=Daphnia pulex TaxID=6669 RepID=UPI001EE0017F|nr:uncharacterized protein LOC124198096 isoform X2 [Daphnia pulex]